jgi:hypothetical protein
LAAIAIGVFFLLQHAYESVHGRDSAWWMWLVLWALLSGWIAILKLIRRWQARRAGDLLLEDEQPPAPRRGKFSGEILLDKEVGS